MSNIENKKEECQDCKYGCITTNNNPCICPCHTKVKSTVKPTVKEEPTEKEECPVDKKLHNEYILDGYCSHCHTSTTEKEEWEVEWKARFGFLENIVESMGSNHVNWGNEIKDFICKQKEESYKEGEQRIIERWAQDNHKNGGSILSKEQIRIVTILEVKEKAPLFIAGKLQDGETYQHRDGYNQAVKEFRDLLDTLIKE